VTAPALGGDSYDSEALWQRHPATRDVYFTTHAYLGKDNPNPQVRAFRKAFTEACGDSHTDAFSDLYHRRHGVILLVYAAVSVGPNQRGEGVLEFS